VEPELELEAVVVDVGLDAGACRLPLADDEEVVAVVVAFDADPATWVAVWVCWTGVSAATTATRPVSPTAPAPSPRVNREISFWPAWRRDDGEEGMARVWAGRSREP
jgi:hypothetical protein